MAIKRHFGGFDTVWREWDYNPDSRNLSSSTESYDVDSEKLKQMYLAQPLQSAETTDTENTATQLVQAENIQFRDGALSERLEMGSLSAGDYDADSDNTSGLGSFLSRPVRIANFTWLENTFTQNTWNPWQLYFSDAQIKKKLDNYARIQCKLRLKFVLNASPFYYGSLRACYFPLKDPRSVYQNIADQVPFSQVPGVYLEPQNMSTAEMTLPFMWTKNWLDATSTFDFFQMGTLNILQYANLRSANGVSGAGVNVSIYAWAEDVRVMGPTTTLALQSDEYEDTDGTISGPASSVAKVAAKLTDVPVIGPFAQATSVGANAVASIARLFGYSNPPVIDDVQPFMNKTFHAFSNSETRMPIDKLTLDPKNEVTISSEVAGVEQDDPLAFNNLLTRESFLLGTLWSGGSAVDTLLWSALVAPGYQINSGAITTHTPVSYFSNMYRYWRGSLIYKFRFIKTKYHKGRLIISWDPVGSNVSSADTETVNLTKIVDLEFEDEVEFVVPYKAATPYLECNQSNSWTSNGTSPTYSYNKSMHNGAITIRVQNVLTGPVLSPQIDILGYVRAGEDFVFAAPTDISTNYTLGDPAGVIQSAEQDDVAIDGNKHTMDAMISAITTGETHASVRPLLHRSTLSTLQYVGNPTTLAATNYMSVNTFWRTPIGPGRTPYGYSNASISAVNTPYQYAYNHPLDWTINCFVGYRGSTTMHINLTGYNAETVNHLSAERWYRTPILVSAQGNRNGVSFAQTSANLGQYGRQTNTNPLYQGSGHKGISLTNVTTQSALSVNIPQYSNSRFSQAFRTVRDVDPSDGTATLNDNVLVRVKHVNTLIGALAADSQWPQLEVYYAAGVDFQPVFFLCTPRTFANTNPASAL